VQSHRNKKAAKKFHIPSDLVVDQWDSYVGVSQVLDFPSAWYA
jgi:hypothetical protein